MKRESAGRRIVLTLILILNCAGVSDLAAAENRQVTVGLMTSPPFVMPDGAGGFKGMAIDLWEGVAREQNIPFTYIQYGSWERLILAVRVGEVDFGVSNVTVTHERAKDMLFSFPWHDGGLRIMVREDAQESLWAELWRNGEIRVYAVLFLVLALLSILMTLVRRRREPEFPEDWKTGFTQSFYELFSAMQSGSLEQKYLGWIGNILAIVWMIFGLGMVAYITSSMTATMTAISISQDGIAELGNLPGKRVGVLRGSVGERVVGDLRMETVPHDTVDDAVASLRNGRVQAVVTDAPVLEYWRVCHPGSGVKVVGALFHLDKYAFAAHPKNAALMRQVSVELIRMYEAGHIREVAEKYFGDAN